VQFTEDSDLSVNDGRGEDGRYGYSLNGFKRNKRLKGYDRDRTWTLRDYKDMRKSGGGAVGGGSTVRGAGGVARRGRRLVLRVNRRMLGGSFNFWGDREGSEESVMDDAALEAAMEAAVEAALAPEAETVEQAVAREPQAGDAVEPSFGKKRAGAAQEEEEERPAKKSKEVQELEERLQAMEARLAESMMKEAEARLALAAEKERALEARLRELAEREASLNGNGAAGKGQLMVGVGGGGDCCCCPAQAIPQVDGVIEENVPACKRTYRLTMEIGKGPPCWRTLLAALPSSCLGRLCRCAE